MFRVQIRGHHTRQECLSIARAHATGVKMRPERIVVSRIDLIFIAGCARRDVRSELDGSRYDGRALADITLQGGALLAELEDYVTTA